MLPDESSRMSEVMDAEGLSEVEEREAAYSRLQLGRSEVLSGATLDNNCLTYASPK